MGEITIEPFLNPEFDVDHDFEVKNGCFQSLFPRFRVISAYSTGRASHSDHFSGQVSMATILQDFNLFRRDFHLRVRNTGQGELRSGNQDAWRRWTVNRNDVITAHGLDALMDNQLMRITFTNRQMRRARLLASATRCSRVSSAIIATSCTFTKQARCCQLASTASPVIDHMGHIASQNHRDRECSVRCLEYRLTQFVGCNNFEFRNNADDNKCSLCSTWCCSNNPTGDKKKCVLFNKDLKIENYPVQQQRADGRRHASSARCCCA